MPRLLRLSLIAISMRRRSYDDSDVQELIRCQRQYISPHQDMRYVARFQRCMRRCAVGNRKHVSRDLRKVHNV